MLQTWHHLQHVWFWKADETHNVVTRIAFSHCMCDRRVTLTRERVDGYIYVRIWQILTALTSKIWMKKVDFKTKYLGLNENKLKWPISVLGAMYVFGCQAMNTTEMRKSIDECNAPALIYLVKARYSTRNMCDTIQPEESQNCFLKYGARNCYRHYSPRWNAFIGND